MIAVIGLNHKSAPIAIREKLAFDQANTFGALEKLRQTYPDMEFVFLSTCNRVELYCAYGPATGFDHHAIVQFYADYHRVATSEFEHLMYHYKDEHAARHLLAVTSSLDSMVVGESQIISQVKESYRLACTAGSSGKVLNRLFHCAFKTAKKVHTQTTIATGRVSVAGVAVELATRLFEDISPSHCVVIGAGEMGELLIQHLLHAGCRNIVVVNRSYERGANLAALYGVGARRWEDLGELLVEANIVIASAEVRDYICTRTDVERILGRRHGGALLIIDLGVPRNVEPTVNNLPSVYLYSLDELSRVAEVNRKAREEDIIHAMEIVNADVAEFMEWLSAKDIGPWIGEIRKRFEEVSTSELERFFVGARQQAPCRSVMEPMVKRLVNRLLHSVITNVNRVANEQGANQAARLVRGILEQVQDASPPQVPESKDES